MAVSLVLSVLAWSVVFATTVFGTAYALRQFRGRSPAQKRCDGALPPIAVRKPVKGAEPDFADNIRTFFEFDYPSYELVFSVADGDDPAVAHIERLRSEYPHVPSRLLVGSVDVGPNRKVCQRRRRSARCSVLMR
jgi:ceramide glucosyltransferase